MDADFSAPGDLRNNGFAPAGRSSDPLYRAAVPTTNGQGWTAGTSTTNSGPLTSPHSRRTPTSHGNSGTTGPQPIADSTALGGPTPSPSTRALFHSLGNRNPTSGEFPLAHPEHPQQTREQPTNTTPSGTGPSSLPPDAAAWLAEIAAMSPSTTHSPPTPNPLPQSSTHDIPAHPAALGNPPPPQPAHPEPTTTPTHRPEPASDNSTGALDLHLIMQLLLASDELRQGAARAEAGEISTPELAGIARRASTTARAVVSAWYGGTDRMVEFARALLNAAGSPS